MSNELLLIGASGHCRSCIDVIEQEGRFSIAGIVDKADGAGCGKRQEESGKREESEVAVLGYSIIGTDDDLPELRKKYDYALVTVGQIKTPDIRMQLFNKLLELGFELPAIISPLAYVSRYARIGQGTIVMHQALVNAGAEVGANCIINTKALVEHDATIADHCHISTGAIVNGGTLLGAGSFMGSCAMSLQDITIGDRCIVGGGGTSAQGSGAKDPAYKLKIGFFGDGPWACNTLSLLQNDSCLKVAFVALRFKQPDQNLQSLAEDFGLPHIKPENINADEFLSWAKKQDCDLFLSVSFDQIFKKEIIEMPAMGTINCHAGKLPFYRGRNILNWALINDEKEFGITVHYVDEGIDTGDIILQKTYPITEVVDYKSLLNTAHTQCPRLVHEAIDMLIQGQVRPVKQTEIHPVGMYCSARGPGDEILDWDMTSREIFNFVRAICEPGPMARTWLGETEICINKVEMVPKAPVYKGIPGAVLFKDSQGTYVKTKDSFVRVVDYRKQGRPLRVGDRLLIK